MMILKSIYDMLFQRVFCSHLLIWIDCIPDILFSIICHASHIPVAELVSPPPKWPVLCRVGH